MGKTEKGTPKDLANKMKAKGLQKLRWYCQMCQKQCRDENGFKCHTMSESHQRQLLLFAENPDKYLDSFSEEFYTDILSVLKRRFGTKRVQANNVYQEYIHDRNHVHMNATQWETLTEFVKWLGREGHCIVDETEKGWYVTYIDRDPETILRQEKLAKKEKYELDAEERRQAFIDKQIKLGLEKAKAMPEAVYTDLKRENDEPIKLSLSMAQASKSQNVPATSSALSGSNIKKSDTEFKRPKEVTKKLSALDEIMQDEKRRKVSKISEETSGSASADVAWLAENIVVKVVTKSLGSAYYKEKGVVLSLLDGGYCCKVQLLSSGSKLKLDQAHLETVVPSVGRQVLILSGKHRDREASLVSLQHDTFSATLKFKDGVVVKGIPYEHFSKLTVLDTLS